MKAKAEAEERSLHATIVLALKQYVSNDERELAVVEKFKEFRPEPPQPTKWFCSTCNTLSRIPRCAKDPEHKVTPA